MNHEQHEVLSGLQFRAATVGALGVLCCALLAFWQPGVFFRSYLTAFNFWLGIPLGCLAIIMLHHLTGGVWGELLRPVLEAAAGTLPVVAVLFLPLLAGLPELYSWSRVDGAASDSVMHHKAIYLNVPFFVIRAVAYFAIWLGLMAALLRWWRPHDDKSLEASHRLSALSGPGLVLYGLTATFAAVDWLMSLQPHWVSTIYPVIFSVGQILSAFAFAVAALGLVKVQREEAGANTLQNLGNLLLAFVMLWAYVSFAQFLLIWSGNLPEEIEWYQPRLHGGWQAVAILLLVGQFALPFLLLLSRDIKRDRRSLAAVAAIILVLHLVDLFWQIVPAFPPDELSGHWPDVVGVALATATLSGIWLAVFVRQLKRRLSIAEESQHG